MEGSAALGEQRALLRPDRGRRCNDGGCDHAGRFWFGTMAYDGRPGAGALYVLEPDGEIRLELPRVGVSNGLAFDPDGELVYYVDSVSGGINSFRISDGGRPSDRRRVVEIPSDCGVPDGLPLDADGCLWAAIWGGGEVRRYASDGRLDGRFVLPTTNVSSCAFGGSRVDALFVTTARVGLSPGRLAEEPCAGSLFTVSLGVSGLPEPSFGGDPPSCRGDVRRMR